MALAPLATVADLTARGVTVDPSEVAAVTLYLGVASTLVRDAAGSPISATVSTVKLEGRGGRLLLPGSPVTGVSAVLADGVAVSDYRLLSGALTRACGFAEGCEFEVTYTHGLSAVPADIVDMVCRLAGQELAALRSGEASSRAITTERIGDYSVTYSDAETGTMLLTDFQRARLAARFGGGAVVVRSL
ncbi:hypothetical protein [Streptomyces sp. NPDC005166]